MFEQRKVTEKNYKHSSLSYKILDSQNIEKKL